MSYVDAHWVVIVRRGARVRHRQESPRRKPEPIKVRSLHRNGSISRALRLIERRADSGPMLVGRFGPRNQVESREQH